MLMPLATRDHAPDLQLLRENYREMLHNASLFEAVYGPVALYEGLPFYAGDHELIIVGYEVDGPRSTNTSSRLIHAVLKERPEIRTVEYWGPAPPLHIPRSFAAVTVQRPDRENRDVVLRLHSGVGSVFDRRDVRRATRNGLTAKVTTVKDVTNDHMAIFCKFLRRHNAIDVEEKKYISAWLGCVRGADSVLIEVHRGGALTGFAILSLFANDTATYAYGFFDNSVAGTSDLAHAAMIQYCRSSGFAFLDLGYSVHSSLLRYKMKWGETFSPEPPWCIRWRRQISDRHSTSVGRVSDGRYRAEPPMVRT